MNDITFNSEKISKSQLPFDSSRKIGVDITNFFSLFDSKIEKFKKNLRNLPTFHFQITEWEHMDSILQPVWVKQWSKVWIHDSFSPDK